MLFFRNVIRQNPLQNLSDLIILTKRDQDTEIGIFVMIVTGENKAEILRDAFCGPVTPQVPASIMQLHPDFTLVADEAALSLAKDLL